MVTSWILLQSGEIWAPSEWVKSLCIPVSGGKSPPPPIRCPWGISRPQRGFHIRGDQFGEENQVRKCSLSLIKFCADWCVLSPQSPKIRGGFLLWRGNCLLPDYRSWCPFCWSIYFNLLVDEMHDYLDIRSVIQGDIIIWLHTSSGHIK